MPVFRDSGSHNPDDLHRLIGERLTAGLLGILDLLAGLGSRDYSQSEATAISEALRQGIGMELQNLRMDVHSVRDMLEEMRVSIIRLERLITDKIDEDEKADEEAERSRTTHDWQPASGRAPREVVIERVFNTAQKLIEEGKDISKMTSTALAHAAGVKPTQFTYAFKTRAGFEQQFAEWREEMRTKTEPDDKTDAIA
ncbi:MAG: hypothetical protein GX162_03605 [Firmicutes bacterium]|jgi:hypothetical protein|nr:hypothetical protein [Bacillota bacterium]